VKLHPTLVAVCRAVHIYLTMLGLVVMLLFAITGFTLNHEDTLGAATPRVAEHEGKVPPALLARHDELRIVEHLRQSFGIRSAMTNFTDLAEEFAVVFKEPGQVWEVTVAKTTGRVTARQESYGGIAILNHLHRGRYTGATWGWVIDVSAAVIVLACLTGFVLWLALPRRRQLGIAFLVLGTLATLAAVYFFVPGPDAPLPSSAPRTTEPRGR
jgi:hypothetical protein